MKVNSLNEPLLKWKIYEKSKRFSERENLTYGSLNTLMKQDRDQDDATFIIQRHLEFFNSHYGVAGKMTRPVGLFGSVRMNLVPDLQIPQFRGSS